MTILKRVTQRITAASKRKRLRVVLAVIAAFTIVAPASATDVSLLVNHGTTENDNYAGDWIEFGGAMYFRTENGVERLDPGAQQPVTVAAFDGLTPTQWVVFQNALVFYHDCQLYAYRSDGTLKILYTAVCVEDRLDVYPYLKTIVKFAGSLVVFDDRLWVWIQADEYDASSQLKWSNITLKRLDDLDQDLVTDGRVHDRRDGGILTDLGQGEGVDLRVDGDYLFVEVVSTGQRSFSDYRWVTEYTRAFWRDGDTYIQSSFSFGYVTENSDLGWDLLDYDYEDSTNSATFIAPLDGAFFHAGLMSYPIPLESGRMQIELNRDPHVGFDQPYELYPMTVNEASTAPRGSFPGSSRPNDFRTTENAVWFTASPDGARRELYRIRAGTVEPEVVGIDTSPERTFRIVGRTTQRIWYTADEGDGTALFYLHEDESIRQRVPLELVGISLVTPSSRTQYYSTENEFQLTAVDDSGDLVTYRITPADLTIEITPVELLINGSSAFVLLDDDTKQWIPVSCQQSLIDAGLPANTVSWMQINAYVTSSDWFGCDELLALVDSGSNPPGGGDDSIQLLLNGAGDASGYVVINNQTRQWVDAACRQQLVDAGLTSIVSNWGEISGYAQSMDWQSCSGLVALVDSGGNPPGGGSDDSIQLLLNGAGDTSAYVVINNQTRQWVNGTCRQQLIDAGLTSTVSNWAAITGYAEITDWQSCSSLVALVDSGSNPPGGGTDDSIQLLLNGAGDISGYVVLNDQTRQWIDGACREQLINTGLNSTVSNWGEISGYAKTTDWRPCSELVSMLE